MNQNPWGKLVAVTAEKSPDYATILSNGVTDGALMLYSLSNLMKPVKQAVTWKISQEGIRVADEL